MCFLKIEQTIGMSMITKKKKKPKVTRKEIKSYEKHSLVCGENQKTKERVMKDSHIGRFHSYFYNVYSSIKHYIRNKTYLFILILDNQKPH